MTTYHGGKTRTGKIISRLIYEECLDIEDDYNFIIKGYCEPFCGMLGVYQHIPELFRDHKPKLTYKGGDINKSVVSMWKSAKKGWKPPLECNKKKYEQIKNSKYNTAEKGFIGHVCTYRGIFFAGYFNHTKSKVKSNADRVQKIGKNLKDNKVNLTTGNYKRFSKLKGYVIYCDPPYQDVEQRYYIESSNYKKIKFNNEEFWEWCRIMSTHNIVFVSEYKAPKDFKQIYSKTQHLTGLGTKGSHLSNEKVFLIF
jgi:DNA adenine methylase